MQFDSTTTVAELEALKDDWARLAAQEPCFVPSFSELRYHASVSGADFRALVAREEGEIKAIACFFYRDGRKWYEIATKKLFAFPVKSASLFGSCVLGNPDEATIQRMFRILAETSEFHVIDLGEIIIESPLYRAITSLRGVVAWSVMRKSQIRWMAQLHGSMETYLASLRPSTKTRVARDGRLFNKKNPDYRIFRRPDEVASFLPDAEQICRLTYQWNLGYQIRDDEVWRAKFTRWAEQDAWRGYLVYVDGEPCAFAWGELAYKTFAFRMTGYDPKYGKLSPGTAIIMDMFRDLIETAGCECIDFGGGSELGYKSRLGNVGPACARMQAAQIYRPYPFFLFLCDEVIHAAKNAIMGTLEKAAGHGLLGRRLKTLLRPFGVGSY
jgi:hypothetical protein